MKRLTATLIAIAVIFSSGLANGQDGSQVSEHLKPYGPMLGTWQYEGPFLEEIPDMAEKGSKCVIQFSWRRILDKNVVMEDFFLEIEGEKKLSGKALIGWNAADKKIVYGSMGSGGGMGMGTVVFDRKAKTSTLTSKGVDGEGKETSIKTVVTKTGKDTLTFQVLERTGGIIEGPSPVYKFTRVPRADNKKSAK